MDLITTHEAQVLEAVSRIYRTADEIADRLFGSYGRCGKGRWPLLTVKVIDQMVERTPQLLIVRGKQIIPPGAFIYGITLEGHAALRDYNNHEATKQTSIEVAS